MIDARVGAVEQTRHAVGAYLTVKVSTQLFDEIFAVPFDVFSKHGHVWRIDYRTQVCLARIVGSNCTLPTKTGVGEQHVKMRT